MGSKAKIVDDILPIMLKERESEEQFFVDAFCGGCSVIEKVTGNRIANDANPYLIAMWIDLLRGRKFTHTIDKHLYSLVRTSTNKKTMAFDDATKGWIGFMASFNGRFFDGGYSGHHHEAKNGQIRDYIRENINNTMRQLPHLKNVLWQCCDYRDIVIPDNSIIYCDPPYKETKSYAISKKFNYDEFYDWCRMMSRMGHKVFISEYNMPNDFKSIWCKRVTNSLHPVLTKRPLERLYIYDESLL
jgi:DNA adenine methylase